MLKRKPEFIFLILLLLSLTIFLAHYAVVGNGIWGDGRYYFVYTRSWVIDQDIDFSNERLVDPFYFDNIPTPIGRVGNKYSVGTPLVWLPSYLSAHAVSHLGNWINLPLSPDGYGHIYRLFVGLSSVTLAVAGLYLSYLVAKKYIDSTSALLAALTIALGSHLFYYLAIDPANSHPPSIFTAGLLLFLWSRFYDQDSIKPIQVIALGLLTGLLGMIRNHDLIYALPILFWIVTTGSTISNKLKHSLIYVAAVFIGLSLYLLTLLKLYGTLISPYHLTGSGFNFQTIKIIPVLFSSNNGLFFFAPILLLSIYGLYQLSQKKQFFGYVGIFLFIIQTIILAGWSGWWGGESFGGRMFLSLTPFFVLGLSQLYSKLKKPIIYTITTISIIFTQVSAVYHLLTH